MSSLCDIAVVVPTVLRPSLPRAVRSVFSQDFDGRIHLLIGIDVVQGDPAMLDRLRAECPPQVMLTVLDLGYSTAQRHGGFYSNAYSGALRTILTYAAHSRYVAYLDDDDWYGRTHLASLRQAIEGHDWAFSYRWLVDAETGWLICRDEWDSLGPDRGINREEQGGFVSPSNLLIDKQACEMVLPLWARAAFDDGTGEDRLVFQALRKWLRGKASDRYDCYYELAPRFSRQPHHAQEFAARGLLWVNDRRLIPLAERHLAEARTAFADGANETALRACEQVLAINPYHTEALSLLARSEWRAGRRDLAYGHLARSLSYDDRQETALATLAAFLQADGNREQAEIVCATARHRLTAPAFQAIPSPPA